MSVSISTFPFSNLLLLIYFSIAIWTKIQSDEKLLFFVEEAVWFSKIGLLLSVGFLWAFLSP